MGALLFFHVRVMNVKLINENNFLIIAVSKRDEMRYSIKFFVFSFKSSRPEVFCEKLFLEISQNSQENICARVSFLIRVTFLKQILWHRYFPVSFLKFIRTPFLIEHLEWLFL